MIDEKKTCLRCHAYCRLEAGIVREIEECEETHAEMFAGLQEKLKAASAFVEAEAEASITARFEPGLLEHVSELCFFYFVSVPEG